METDVVILAYDFAKAGAQAIANEFIKLGYRVEIVEPSRTSVLFSNQGNVALIDQEEFTCKLVILRSINYIFPYLKPWLRTIRETGAQLLNGIESIDPTLDKALTLEILVNNKINIVPALSTIGTLRTLPFVGENLIKPAFGSGGRGIEKVTIESANKIIESSNDTKPSILEHNLIQPLVSPFGIDFRSVVLNGVQIAQTRRVAPDGRIATNGKESHVTPSNIIEVEELGLKATKSLNLEFAAVDIIVHENHYAVLEVNYSPGIEFTSMSSGVNIAEFLAKHSTKYLN